MAQCGGAIAGASVMLGLFGGDNVGDLGLGEAVLGLEFLLTFMIVLAYLRVSKVSIRALEDIIKWPPR
mgnify:CR=1 FL=1